MLKACIYVLSKQAKQNYKNECFDIRINAGITIVKDMLQKANICEVEYASSATVHKYDIVLYSITSDCDWWNFIEERQGWQPGNYKIIVGGAGVLNVRPFLSLVDYFVLGRAENIIANLITAIEQNKNYENKCVVDSKTFNVEKQYYINQVDCIYKYNINLENGDEYHEDIIGCNHRCLFCGYTWHRKQVQKSTFEYSGLWHGSSNRERAMLDINDGADIDLNKLRTTAIDGLSERLRYSVNKKITNKMLVDFLIKLQKCDKPHQVKFYNLVGLPTETTDDWFDFLNCLKLADKDFKKTDKQTSILLHSTPFRPMPATPMACKPMSYINYRGLIAKTLGKNLKGNIFYQGNAIWAVESMATESLPTVIQSAIILRGTEKDTDNICKISKSKKYWSADTHTKQATLEKYFDVTKLFGCFTRETLPTRNINSYANVKKMW